MNNWWQDTQYVPIPRNASLIGESRVQVDRSARTLSSAEVVALMYAHEYPLANVPLGADPEQMRFAKLYVPDAAFSAFLLDPPISGWPSIRAGELARSTDLCFRFQGARDLPPAKRGRKGDPSFFANDVERRGRLPLRVLIDPSQTSALTQWGVFDRIYFGANYATPMVGMFRAMAALRDPSSLLRPLSQEHNDGSATTTDVVEAIARSVRFVLDETNATEHNPEGYFEATQQATLAWGGRDDGLFNTTQRDGTLPRNRVIHADSQAFVVGFLRSVADLLTQIEQSSPRELDLDEAGAARLRERCRDEFESTPVRKMRAVAERLNGYLEREFVADDPDLGGEYVIYGKWRDERGRLADLDIAAGKTLSILATGAMTSERSERALLRMMLDPRVGMVSPVGLRDLSCLHPTYSPDSINAIVAPMQSAMAALGAAQRGYVDAASEMSARVLNGFRQVGCPAEFWGARADGTASLTERIIELRHVAPAGQVYETRWVTPPMRQQLWSASAELSSQRVLSQDLKKFRTKDTNKLGIEREVLNALFSGTAVGHIPDTAFGRRSFAADARERSMTRERSFER